MRTWIAVFCVFCVGHAYATAAEWHWENFGSGGYSGQINLVDDQGSALGYQRFDAAGSPSLFGSASVQSPLTVIAAGANVQVDTIRTGVAVPKITCKAGEALEFHGAFTAACNNGTASDIQGLYITASQAASTLTPFAWVYVNGPGWVRINNNHPCGVIMAIQQCRKP